MLLLAILLALILFAIGAIIYRTHKVSEPLDRCGAAGTSYQSSLLAAGQGLAAGGAFTGAIGPAATVYEAQKGFRTMTRAAAGVYNLTLERPALQAEVIAALATANVVQALVIISANIHFVSTSVWQVTIVTEAGDLTDAPYSAAIFVGR